MNVVGYTRVSTQGQARDGYSLKYQEYKGTRFKLSIFFRAEGIFLPKLIK